MNESSRSEMPVELLQQLGLKEYEAKSFVALSRVEHGTAKEISELSDIPRTRVYDAARVLESKGLVEVQHSSPKIFRAVTVDEAVKTLEAEYEDRFEMLRDRLQNLEPATKKDDEEVAQEVWTLRGDAAIASRTLTWIENAEQEILMVIGSKRVFSDELATALQAARERGVEVNLGTASEALEETIQSRLPEADVFVAGLEWLDGTAVPDDRTEISRLLLIDRSQILVSTYEDEGIDEQSTHEMGVYGAGFNNGIVTIVRRILATGLQAEPSLGN